ncbi:hypothetical protein L6164_000944 [Bauhinia variegata]|uniref:Uncharacterized protein n=1 Tax=Bauhinia variegata TaxID=167791 RepID=A0ACB9Q7I4_BAUVA|nr:hypothetical protein L6164_000944 [Bauhinia variegata]
MFGKTFITRGAAEVQTRTRLQRGQSKTLTHAEGKAQSRGSGARVPRSRAKGERARNKLSDKKGKIRAPKRGFSDFHFLSKGFRKLKAKESERDLGRWLGFSSGIFLLFSSWEKGKNRELEVFFSEVKRKLLCEGEGSSSVVCLSLEYHSPSLVFRFWIEEDKTLKNFYLNLIVNFDDGERGRGFAKQLC